MYFNIYSILTINTTVAGNLRKFTQFALTLYSMKMRQISVSPMAGGSDMNTFIHHEGRTYVQYSKTKKKKNGRKKKKI